MAIYDLGTASLAANGEVTGVGTTWKAPLTLIRVGATIVFKTEPVQIYTISEIISDTQVNVYNPNSETVPAGTGYAILAHDGITVQGLAQDVAETLRYYQSRETEVADAVDAFNNFDANDFESKVTQVNTQHGDIVSIGLQVSADAAQVSADKDAASASAISASNSQNAAENSALDAERYAQSVNPENFLNKSGNLSGLSDKSESRKNIGLYFYNTVSQVKSDTSIPVGTRVFVEYYHEGVSGGHGYWVKTSTIASPNMDPSDLNGPYFSDANGNVYNLDLENESGINIEQLGGKPYTPGDLSTDLKDLLLAIFKFQYARNSKPLIVNFNAREYYSSKGVTMAPWSTYRCTSMLGVQFSIDPNKWTESEIPPVAYSGVNTFWSNETFLVSAVHKPNQFANNIEISNIDFIGRAGNSMHYGMFMPFLTEFEFNHVRCIGCDTGLYWVNMYSGTINRCIYNARVNSPSGAGSWGMRCVERVVNGGCGTSVTFNNCNFTDFILGFDVVGMSYTTSINHITEGTKTQVAGTLRRCDWTFTQWGIERLTSESSESLIRILGGNVTINGVALAYDVTANNTAFIEISNGARVNLFGVNGSLSNGLKTDSFIVTTDDSEVVIGPVKYPNTGSYANKLGDKTYMFGTGGNIKTRPDVYSSTSLNSISDTVNTSGKYMGRAVYASSLGTMVYASGPKPGDKWRNGVGTVVYTPV